MLVVFESEGEKMSSLKEKYFELLEKINTDDSLDEEQIDLLSEEMDEIWWNLSRKEQLEIDHEIAKKISDYENMS